MRESRKVIYIILFIFSISLFAPATVADMPLSALITPDSEVNIDRSTAISYSGDGNLLAVAFEKEVYLYHTTTRNELEISPIILNDLVKSVEFTSDSSNQGAGYLLVGRESTLTNTPAISIYATNGWSHSYVEEGRDVSSIVTIMNSEGDYSFAYATEHGGFQYIYEYSFSDLIEPINQIKTSHNQKITCLDYDSENEVFISGSLGRVELNIPTEDGGEMVEEHIESGRTIFDCKFSKDGIYAWSSEDGVKVRESNHDFLQSLNLPNTISAQKIIFENNSEVMRLLTNENGNTLSSYYTTGNWNNFDNMALGHVVMDLDINPNNGDVAASTYSQYIAIYATNWIDPNVIESPLEDLDHDGIEDQDDEDRDGDGIPNQTDSSCESTTPCNLVSDTNFIRNVKFTVEGDRFTISETIYFSFEFSESLRLITAESLVEDGYIKPDERTNINTVFCSKIDKSAVLDAWYGVTTFDNNSLIAGIDSVQFSCDGLTNLAHDSRGRISLSWSMGFELVHEVSSNYTLTFKSPPLLGYGMPNDLAHSNPIKLTVMDSDIKTYVIESWFDDSGVFELEFIGEVEKESIEVGTLIKYLQYTSYTLLSIAFMVLTGLFIIRRKNRFSIDDISSRAKQPPVSKRKNRQRPPSNRSKGEPSDSKNPDKEYGYYNPGRREGDDWNYGDDGEYYYSESYTDYKKASDSVKKSKVRKVKVGTNPQDNNLAKQENIGRRRISRKKNKKVANKERMTDSAHTEAATSEETPPETSKEDFQATTPDDIAGSSNIEEVKNVIKEEFKEVKKETPSNNEDDEFMDKALDKFFK